jgi:hypothetical protein
MSKFIKDFDGFLNEDKIEESILDTITSAFTSLGKGITDTIKQKVAAAMLAKLGIKEDSVWSVFIQEFVDEIPLSDYPLFLKGDFDMKYWAPKIVKSFSAFLMREGLDNLAAKMGFDNKGWIYSTLRETLENEMKKEKFEENLVKLLTSLSGEGMGDEINKSLTPDQREKISGSLYDVAKKQTQQDTKDSSSGGALDSILSVFGASKK